MVSNLEKKRKVNNEKEEEIKILNNLVEIQRSCIKNADDRYMIGLYNGLVLAKSVIEGNEPLFYEEEGRFKGMEEK